MASIPFDLLRDDPKNLASMTPGLHFNARNGPASLCGVWVVSTPNLYGWVVEGTLLRCEDDKLISRAQYIRLVRRYQTRMYWLGCGISLAVLAGIILVLAACIKVLL